MSDKNKKNSKKKKKILGIPSAWLVGILVGIALLGGFTTYAAKRNYVPGNDGNPLEFVGEHVNEFFHWVGSFASKGNANNDHLIAKQAHYYATQKKLSREQKAEVNSLALQYGVDTKKYPSYKAVAQALENKFNKKTASEKQRAGNRINFAGRADREKKYKDQANQKFHTGLNSIYKGLPKSQYNKVKAYLKKHGDSYANLEEALNKYATGKNASKLKDLEKRHKKDIEDANQGDKKTTKNDAEKQLKQGKVEPQTFAGKVGQALLNLFWASPIGDWLQQNAAGVQIFAGLGVNTDGNTILSNPMVLIYPANSNYSIMGQISNILQPAMIAAGGALITLALVISSMQMGWGQAFDPVRSRLAWYHNITDMFIAIVGVAAFPAFVSMVLKFDGSVLIAFQGLLSNVQPLDGSNGNLFAVAQQLGFDKKTINAITTGSALGGSGTEFAGIIFSIIYILATIGLTVYIKYFYFVRAITFTILISIGPIFIALWSFTFYGKGRTIAWLKDFLGTVLIQDIHALTVTFMALFMSANNALITQGAVKNIVKNSNYNATHPVTSFIRGLPFVGGSIASKMGAPTTSSADYVRTFEAMVMGFIILILFQPLSKSLADLFGLSTNMLDNIHKSTSRTLKATALAAGAVAGGLTLGAAGMASGGLGALGKAGLGTAKAASAGKAIGAKALGKNFAKNLKSQFQKRKPIRKSLARMNGVVGPNAGRLMGMAAGAGAGDPETMLALSAAGGAIGARAARLANKPLASMGLGKVKRFGKAIKKGTDASNKQAEGLVGAANEKTTNGKAAELGAVRDAEDGNLSANLDKINAKMKANQKAWENGEIDAKTRDKNYRDLQNQAQPYLEAKRAGSSISDDAKAKLAAADARQQLNGEYANAKTLGATTREALGSEAYKMDSSDPNNAGGMQKALALSGAATTGAVKSRVDSQAVEAAKSNAAKAYESANADQFAQNGYADKQSWMASTQYQKGLASEVNAAGQDALNNSAGHIYSMPDQSNNLSFGSSMVNKGTYKQALQSEMNAAGVSAAAQQKALRAVDGVQGQSLVSETKIGGSNAPLQTLNYDLDNKLAGQAAYSINNAGMASGVGKQVTADDLSQVYKPDYNPSTLIGGQASDNFNADALQKYVSRAQKANAARTWLSDFYADYQNTQADLNNAFDEAAASSNPYNLNNWLSGGTPVSGFGGSFSGGTPTANDYIASQRIASFDQNMGGLGADPADAIDQLRGLSSDSVSGIPAGDLQLVTNNTGSYVRAKTPAGGYEMVGQYGIGDPSLRGEDSIIQDLDVGNDGMIGPRYDPNTHTTSQPYSISDGLRIPRSYSNGNPDLSTMIGNYATKSFNAPVDMSDYHTMSEAPELRTADASQAPITLDKLGDNYDNYSYYSDGDQGVIVGRDKRDGTYKQLSNMHAEDLLDFKETGTQYRIPLKDSGNGLVPDDSYEPELFTKDAMSAQDKKEILSSLKDHMTGTSSRMRFNSYLNDMLLPTERNLHNFIGTNPANTGIDGLDLTTID